jgi:molybdate transport system regulatory protein
MTRLTLRVDFGPGQAIGRGKIQLLEAIRDKGSITGAGRALGMSYKRAWELVDQLNTCFRDPVVTARAGGQQGGGAALTELGERIVKRYRAIEAAAEKAAAVHIRDIETALRSPPAD